METINYRQVIARAIADEMRADPRVFLLGEDVARAGGAFKTTPGLFEEFGEARVLDTPISEQAIIGAAFGCAVMGMRPIAEIMFADFAGVCFDQIVNQVAKYRYMSGGQVSVPLTIRMATGAGAGFSSQHSQPAENWFLNVPGLKIVTPGSVEDLYLLLRAAIQDPNPVLFFEHKNLFSLKGTLPGPESSIPDLGRGSVVRSGTDVTVVAIQQMRLRALEAADQLASQGISVEVLDPRCLVPFDDALVHESLKKTSRLVVVQEAQRDGSWGSSLISRVITRDFELLDAPPQLLCTPDTPVPYAGNLEEAWLPSTAQIVARIKHIMRY